jgi:hypothetical protein
MNMKQSLTSAAGALLLGLSVLCLPAFADPVAPPDQNKAVKEKRHEFKEACGADMEKFCSDVKVGKGRKIVCLKQHRNELSPACQEKLSSMHQHHSAPMTVQPAGGN